MRSDGPTAVCGSQPEQSWGLAFRVEGLGFGVSGLWFRSLGRGTATWKREFKLPWREAGAPDHHDDKADSDQ